MRFATFNVGETVYSFGENPSWVGVLVLGSIEIFEGSQVLYTVRLGEQFGHLPYVWGASEHFNEVRLQALRVFSTAGN